MGNLFFRGQAISEIKSLRFAELREWNEWHELMVKKEQEIMDEAKKKNA